MRRRALIAGLMAGAAAVGATGIAVTARSDHSPARRSAAAPAAVSQGPSPLLAPLGAGGAQPTAAGLAHALAGLVHDRRLGPRVGYSIADALTGHRLAGVQDARPATPASVTKLATAAAVLTRPGAGVRLVTRVMAGASAGDVVLVGGGDPTLSVGARQAYAGGPRLDRLAAAVRRVVHGPIRRLLVDTSAYAGPTTATGWDTDLVGSGNVAPITALMIDGGRLDPARRARSSTPDLAAGRAFARLLGVPAGEVARGRASAHAAELARVTSRPVGDLVEQMLTLSDNVLAEALARRVAVAGGEPASFAGAVAAISATLDRTGAPTAGLRLYDGSGLSRRDLLPAGLLTSLLAKAAGGTALRPILTGLPVAGYSGTLADRFHTARSRPGAGDIRAKTGTLSGVSALAGVVRDASGRLLAFAVLADRVPAGGTAGAEAALDAAATTLSRCGCR